MQPFIKKIIGIGLLGSLFSCYSLMQQQDDTINRADVVGGQVINNSYATSEIDIEQSGTVANVTKVTDFNEPGISVSHLDLSSRGILFSKFDPSKRVFDIWFRSAQGMQRIIGDQFMNVRPRWSKDNMGEHVFFASNRQGNMKFWRVKSSGVGGLTPITNGSGNDADFDINAKDNKMIYSTYPGTGYLPQLWLTNLDGSGQTMIGNGYQPNWAPDGNTVYYVEKVNNVPQIWSMRRDATSKTQISTCKKGCTQPSISPDGKKMIYVSEDSGNQDIWLMDLRKGELTQLTTNLSADIEPTFSMDGKTIFFISSRGRQWNIWRMDLT